MRRIFICLLIACLVHVHAKPALSEEQGTLGSTEDAGNREQTHAEDEARTPGEELPLWEAGLGFTVLDFADYRGSDERSQFILPIPYVIYRGEALKIERDRVRGLFFEYERVTAQLSLGGSVPVNSEDNAARQGMPDRSDLRSVSHSWPRPSTRIHPRQPCRKSCARIGQVARGAKAA